MKAVFISYNQALTDRVHNILDDLNVRGFTKWDLTTGRGSVDGEPHLGSHAWPSMNSSIMVVVEDDRVEVILNALRELDALTKRQGLKAFVWKIKEAL
ncbi:MAG: PG0541 family transporter-associated protein [Rikenellaceae bacterium]